MSEKTRYEGRETRRTRSRGKAIGTPERPRLAVFVSNRHVYTQVIDDASGRTLASAGALDTDVREQAKGKPMAEKAKLVGALIAERAKAASVEKVVFDRCGFKYGKRLGALADSARKGGLVF